MCVLEDVEMGGKVMIMFWAWQIRRPWNFSATKVRLALSVS